MAHKQVGFLSQKFMYASSDEAAPVAQVPATTAESLRRSAIEEAGGNLNSDASKSSTGGWKKMLREMLGGFSKGMMSDGR